MRIQRYVLVPFVALLVGCVEGGNAGNKPSDTSPIDASNDSLNTVVDTLVSGDSVVASDVSVDGGAPADAIQDMANPQDTAPDTSLPEDVGVTVDAGAEDMATAEDTAEPPPKELCAAVDEKAEWELCDSGPDFCAVVFTDEAGCSAVCETLGLECYATWDNISDECAPNTTLPPLTCDPPSNHQSDYCVCRTVDSPCEPQCDGKACGDDGCGGPCGSCDQGVPCVDNQCSCVPKTCESELFHCGANHDDGCGGTFSCQGSCPPEMGCDQGFCGGPPKPCVGGDCPAFPGAEGEGMFAVGGRGGDVCHVTNLKDKGTGSLRHCADTQSGARTIVFDVAGRIKLNKILEFKKNKLTIAGQTAPGDGVVVSGYGASIVASDVIVQHIRFRPGDDKAPKCPGGGNGFTEDSLTLKGQRIIVDHVSTSWGIDENLSGGNEFKDVTVQYSIISEGLYQTGLWHGECNEKYEPGGDKGHSMGSLFKPSVGDGDISIHHNLYAHNGNRNPAVGSYDDDQVFRADIRNNVIYNCPSMGYSSGASEKVYVNYVGNYGIFGPSSKSDDLFKGNADNNLKLYRNDNRLDKDEDGKFDGKDHGSSMWGGEFDDSDSAFTFKDVTTHVSKVVPSVVLSWAGARPWSRDAPDERVVNDVEENKGTLIDSQDDVGAWGTLDTGKAVADKDGDGLPDGFEVAYGTDPNKADHNGDLDGDGYTNLENYLHWASRPR